MDLADPPPKDEGRGRRERWRQMLGPLPRLYRSLVAAAALLVFIGLGVVLAQVLPLPFGGVFVGSAVGLLIAFVLVHDFHHRRNRPTRTVRRHP